MMKKVISILLLVALCIGCFAGCADIQNLMQPEAPEKSALEQAKEYLFAMYKDSPVETTGKYTVISQIRVGDVVYPIEWSTDMAENVTITAGENNQTVVATTGGPEKIEYKLIGTIKDADGNSVSVSFKHTIPAVKQIEDGTLPTGSIVLSYPGENKYVTGKTHLYEAKQKYELILSDKKADALAMEVINNGDGTVTFKSGDKYLFCDANHVKYADVQDDNTKFILEETEGGYFIKCAVANYNGNAQYLEVYSGYLTSYGMNASNPGIYTFKFESADGAGGSVGDIPQGGNTNPTQPTQPTQPKPTTPSTPSTGSYTQVSELKDGDKVVIVNPAYNMALSMNKVATYYNEGVDVSGGFGSITNAEIFTVKKNSDGTYSFTSLTGKVLALADEFSSLNDTGANNKWELSSAGGKLFNLKNTVRGNYLEWYASKNNWSTYASTSLGDEFALAFYSTTGNGGNGGTVTPPATQPTQPKPTTPTTPSTPSGSTTVTGKLAATLDLLGTTTRVSRTASQTVHAANGITYTNDKASSITDNYDQAQNYAARAYQGSTVKIEYTGMVKIVFTLDDFSSGKYLTGFDGMTVDGATISREGDTVTIAFAKATNVFQSAELLKQVRIEKIDVYTA